VYAHRSGMEAWSVTITTSVLSFHISWFKVSICEGGWRGTDQYKITELQLLEITCNQNVCSCSAAVRHSGVPECYPAGPDVSRRVCSEQATAGTIQVRNLAGATDLSFLRKVQTGSESHSAYFPIRSGFYPEGTAAGVGS